MAHVVDAAPEGTNNQTINQEFLVLALIVINNLLLKVSYVKDT